MSLMTISKSESVKLAETTTGKTSLRSSWFQASGFHCCGAMLGLGGGIILPLIGFVLLVIGRFDHDGNLHLIGTLLLLTTIPLLIFGAYCLDMLEKGRSQK